VIVATCGMIVLIEYGWGDIVEPVIRGKLVLSPVA
jgi:hypothetical protein